MTKKIGYPRVAACKTLIDIRRLLSKVPWKSREYRVLMNQWRLLCRCEIFKIHGTPNRSALAEPWRELYAQCPSGSPEEKISLGFWQQAMPYERYLARYRQRVVREGCNLLAQFAPELI